MAGSVTAALSAIGGEAALAATPAKTTPAKKTQGGGDALVVVPAGFIADIVGGLSGTVGEITGGFFGEAKLGKKIGEAASPLIKLLPFQVIPAEVAPQSAGPDGQGAVGPAGDLIVVPAGFLGGILGGLGGKLLGGQVDRWLGGGGGTGSALGSTVGGAIGAVLPFQVVPPATAPGGDAAGEPMVVVPAGFLGDLLGGVAGVFDRLKRESVMNALPPSSFDGILPFQAVPPELAPASAGPDGAVADEERLIVVPADFFGSIVGGLASTIGGEIGGWFGGRDTGAAIGDVAGKLLESVLPFHEVPPALAPASAGPAGGASDEKLMLVPAGLFGNLLSGLAGAAGGVAGGLLGDAKTGRAVGDAAAPLLKLLPFQVVAPAGAE